MQVLPRLYEEDEPHDVDEAATTQQDVANAPAPIESSRRTMPIPRAVAASVVASVDAGQASMMPQAVVPAPSRSPWAPPPDPPWPNISTGQLLGAALVALALFITGVIAFLRSRGVL